MVVERLWLYWAVHIDFKHSSGSLHVEILYFYKLPSEKQVQSRVKMMVVHLDFAATAKEQVVFTATKHADCTIHTSEE